MWLPRKVMHRVRKDGTYEVDKIALEVSEEVSPRLREQNKLQQPP